MIKIFIRLIISGLILIYCINLNAQVTLGIVKGMLVEVNTKDKMEFIGHVEEINDSTIVLSHENYKKMELNLSNIKSIRHISDNMVKNGVIWPENSNFHRNYYSPTGIGMEKGQAYYQNLMVVWNHLGYAFTDYFTMGIDFEIISILSGGEVFDTYRPLFALTPKLSHSFNDKWHAGVGGLIVSVPKSDSFFDLGILYTVGTYGSKDNNFTVGFGIPYFESEVQYGSPVITLSGQYRVSRKFSIVSENWFIAPEDEGLFGFGVQGLRYLGKNLNWDIGLILYKVDDDFGVAPFPFVGLAIHFGK
jgi:hypothetical protein